jgi:hypothetical protein
LSEQNSYKGNSFLPKAGTLKEITEEQQVEIAKCMMDPVYFGEKYFQIVHQDHGLIPMDFYDYQKEAVRKFYQSGKLIMAASRQSGKAIDVETEIPLASGGFKKLKDLKVGDKIVGSNGRSTNVLFKSQVHYKKTYKITFDDDTSINACMDHLWTVKNRFRSHREETITTEQLFNSVWRRNNSRGYQEYAYYIPNVKPVEYNTREQLIDPYILGAWLGDGSKHGGRFFCHVNQKQFFESQGIEFCSQTSYNRTPGQENVFDNTIKGISGSLKHYGVTGNKHIPDDYMYGDIGQRIALLQGIIDTDGHVDSNGNVQIQLTNKVPRLIEDVYQLLTSLGFKVTRKTFLNSNFKTPTSSTRLSFTPDGSDFDVCRLPYKLVKIRHNLQRKRYVYSRTIQNIEEINTIPTQCIQVDAVDSLYATSRNYLITHNTTSITVIILHEALFNKNKNIALLANKLSSAREILSRIKTAYEYLPDWLKGGILKWNEGEIKFENGTRIFADASEGNSIRGKSIYLLYVDEAAFVEDWDTFSQSVLPTVSSVSGSKIIFTSTPNGLNHFFYYCEAAKEKKSNFDYIEVPWWLVPGRDEKWKEKTLAELNYDEQKFAQEYSVEFMGSSGTLISGAALKLMREATPIKQDLNLRIFVEPQKDHTYIMTVDTSRGKMLDYHCFQIIDISTRPYEQVCTFRNNRITVPDYASIVFRLAVHYNNANTLVELNDLGSQLVDILFMEYEYEHLLMTEAAGRAGRRVSSGHGKKIDRGMPASEVTRNAGCMLLKSLIEQQQLKINDKWTIDEFKTFSLKGKKYQAEPGKHDDTVMPFVWFGWLSNQDYFKQLTDSDINKLLREQSEEDIDDQLLFFGIVSNGIDPWDDDITVVKAVSGDWFDQWMRN